MAENDGKDTDTGRQDPPKDQGKDDDDQDADDDDQGDDEGKDGGDDFKPPTKDEWAKVQRALRKANREAANLRKKSSPGGSGGDDSGKDADATRAAKAEAEKTEMRTKRTAGMLALTSEGLNRDQAKRLVGLLNLDDVEVDEFGDADLEDQIEDLKEEFPALFAKDEDRRGGARRPRTSGGRSSSDGGGTKTPDQTHSERMLRAAGYRR